MRHQVNVATASKTELDSKIECVDYLTTMGNKHTHTLCLKYEIEFGKGMCVCACVRVRTCVGGP